MKLNQKQICLINYLKDRKEHAEAEEKLSEDEFLPINYNLIEELRKYYTGEEIDYIIINRQELIDTLL